MTNYAALKHDIFLTGPALREMGASAADDDGIIWMPRDQMISQSGRSVTLAPDPESLRRAFAKQARAVFASKKSPVVSGSKNSPAYAYDRMLARPGMRALMSRLQRKGLVPKAPDTYAALKPTEPKKVVLKPRVNPLMTMQKSLDLLRIKPGTLEAMTGAFADAGGKLLGAAMPQPVAGTIGAALRLFGPKRRGHAYNFG